MRVCVLYLQPLEQHFNVSNPVFQIHQGGEGDKFFINGALKELKVGPQALDREEQDQYTLVVELLSNGKNRGFAMVRDFFVDNYAVFFLSGTWIPSASLA